MEETNNSDVKPGDETPSESPAENNDSEVSEDVKTREKKADELLSREKRILVDKDRFNERNDKAKLFEAHAPLLEKVLKDPELVERLLEKESGSNLEERLARLEEEKKAEKRNEMRGAVADAFSKWPDFEKSWDEVKPLADELSKKHSYKEALARAYIAVHTELANAETERMAKDGMNQEGVFTSGGTYSPNVGKINQTKLSDADKRIAKAQGYSEEQYIKIQEKWKQYGIDHGWDKA